MSTTDRFFDVGPALFGGYRVALIRGLRLEGQALFDTAHDVAATAALSGLPVLTMDDQIIQACKALNVATALPPPFDKKAWRWKELNDDRSTTPPYSRRRRPRPRVTPRCRRAAYLSATLPRAARAGHVSRVWLH